MRTGAVVADLRELWPGHDLPYVPEMIEAKRAGEHGRLSGIVAAQRLADDIARLHTTLDAAATATALPDRPARPPTRPCTT